MGPSHLFPDLFRCFTFLLAAKLRWDDLPVLGAEGGCLRLTSVLL